MAATAQRYWELACAARIFFHRERRVPAGGNTVPASGFPAEGTGVVTLVIGHKGAAGLAPENSLAAFRVAREVGADGVELDVRRTADGALAVHHDATLGDGRRLLDLAVDELPDGIVDTSPGARRLRRTGARQRRDQELAARRRTSTSRWESSTASSSRWRRARQPSGSDTSCPASTWPRWTGCANWRRTWSPPGWWASSGPTTVPRSSPRPSITATVRSIPITRS